MKCCRQTLWPRSCNQPTEIVRASHRPGCIDRLRRREFFHLRRKRFPASGVRTDIHPAEWARTGLVFDVRNGDLIEGWYGRPYGKHTVRWSAIVLRPAEPIRTAIPETKLKRIDWDDWWKHEIARRQQGLLPNKKEYLREAEPLMKERYGVNTVPPSELRRIKAALYRGDSERPKRSKRKKSKPEG